jgi:hypothetical protein
MVNGEMKWEERMHKGWCDRVRRVGERDRSESENWGSRKVDESVKITRVIKWEEKEGSG